MGGQKRVFARTCPQSVEVALTEEFNQDDDMEYGFEMSGSYRFDKPDNEVPAVYRETLARLGVPMNKGKKIDVTGIFSPLRLLRESIAKLKTVLAR
jgi:hypothetical protein